MNEFERPKKQRPILKVPRCKTCSNASFTQGTSAPKPLVILTCRKWGQTVPEFGFCHEHPEVIAHA